MTPIELTAWQQLAAEYNLPDTARDDPKLASMIQRRAAGIAIARFKVTLWDDGPLGWIGKRLGLRLRDDIRARAAMEKLHDPT